jgi:Replication-relaxation
MRNPMDTAMITERDILILRLLYTYYLLNRPQVQRLVFPNDLHGRVTRRRLQMLVAENLICRLRTFFCHPSASPGPVYHLAQKGCELLAEHFEDDRYLATNTASPIPHHVFHWLAVVDTHILLNQAVASQTSVKVEGWINEWDIVNKDESAPEKRFNLYTLIRENPRLVCAPDSAFLLSAYGHSKIFYLEQDRGTSGVQQIANGKTSGYAALFERNLQQRHFQATVPGFTVLMIAPSARRRDNLRRAIAEKQGSTLWRFAAVGDMTPESALHSPIWFSCNKDEPGPLVKEASA